MILQKIQCRECFEQLRSGPAPFEFAPAPRELACGNCGADVDAGGFPFRFAYYFKYTLRLWIYGAALATAYGMWELGEGFQPVRFASGVTFLGIVLGIVPSLVLAWPVGFVIDLVGRRLGVERSHARYMRRAEDDANGAPPTRRRERRLRPRLAIVRDTTEPSTRRSA